MQVILSDGDLSTLANMKLNLEKNGLNTETNLPEASIENQNVVSSSHGHFIPCHQVLIHLDIGFIMTFPDIDL